jgi:hypothetical protein
MASLPRYLRVIIPAAECLPGTSDDTFLLPGIDASFLLSPVRAGGMAVITP